MCFSPEADLTGGLIVTVVGIDALRHVTQLKQLALAALPILLAAHEVDEAFVWWGLRGQVAWSVGHAAAVVYLTFAFLLPVLAPIAVMGIEARPRRRAAMGCLLAVGSLVSVMLLSGMFHGIVSARIDGRHIAYTADVVDGPLVAVLYVLATCGTLLVSSDRKIVVFGASNVVAVILLAWLTIGGLTSLWCGWAAIASVGIALYLRAAGGTKWQWPNLGMWKRDASASVP